MHANGVAYARFIVHLELAGDDVENFFVVVLGNKGLGRRKHALDIFGRDFLVRTGHRDHAAH